MEVNNKGGIVRLYLLVLRHLVFLLMTQFSIHITNTMFNNNYHGLRYCLRKNSTLQGNVNFHGKPTVLSRNVINTDIGINFEILDIIYYPVRCSIHPECQK